MHIGFEVLGVSANKAELEQLPKMMSCTSKSTKQFVCTELVIQPDDGLPMEK